MTPTITESQAAAATYASASAYAAAASCARKDFWVAANPCAFMAAMIAVKK